MKKQVIETTCDNCGDSEWVDYETANPDFTLPKNWMHVEGVRNFGTVFELDTCPECTMFILAAGGRMPITPQKKPKQKIEYALEVGSPEHDALIAEETMKMAIEDERLRVIDLLGPTATGFLDRMSNDDAENLLVNSNWSHNRLELFDGDRKLVLKGEKVSGAYEYLKERLNNTHSMKEN